MTFAYADPPYLGSSRKHYRDHPDHAKYDTLEGHRQLIEELVGTADEGWALSMASKNLRDLLPLCPADARVMAWVKPFTTFWPNVNPAWAWEPVVVWTTRKLARPTLRDWVSAVSPAQGGGYTGEKPAEFCFWLFSVLGLDADDEFIDVFPGSGAVSRAWAQWCAQEQLWIESLA